MLGIGGDKGNKSSRTAAGVETLVGARVVIRGDVQFSGGLYVEGRIHGAVLAEEGGEALLTLAEKGCIHGEVRAPHIVINGLLEGDVYAAERIELGPTARVQGNVYYKVIEMAAGAMITGRMVHAESAPKQLPKPEKAEKAREREAEKA